MKKCAPFLVAAMLAALVFSGAPAGAQSDEPAEPQWFVDETSLPFEDLSITDVEADQHWGVRNGYGYRIEVPKDWNGDLIMFAHGFRGEGERLFLFPGEGYIGDSTDAEFPDEFRKWMLEEGYAWAMSTYSKNSYNVKAGVVETRDLAKFFKKTVAKPEHTYITGYSMGGHITAVSAEWYGNLYDGAMPMCGVVGDYELFDYFLDATAAASQIALGRSQFPVAEDHLTNDLVAIKDALGMNPDPATWFTYPGLPLTEAGEQYKQLLELRSGGDRPNFDEAFEFWNSFPTASGLGNFLWELGLGDGTVAGGKNIIVDNKRTRYQVDLDPAMSDFERQLNREIVRVSPTKRNRDRTRSNPPAIRGKLKMPVLTLHNLGDLFVPFNNEVQYAKDARSKGRKNLLVQRAIRGVSHCGFTPNEMIDGMTDLINWAENGVKPAGDKMSKRAIADANYGCKFTQHDSFGHNLATPCPGDPT